MNKVIFDIDGTLADVDHRLHHIKGEKKDWDAFYGACIDDTAIESICTLLDHLVPYYETLFVTGRPEKYRQQTMDWLVMHDLIGRNDHHLLRMRADGDFRPDYVVKRELVPDEELPDILFVVEDRAQVVRMWRERGLMCLHCAEGEF